MKRQAYDQLNRINQSFDEVLDNLRSLRKHPALRDDVVRRFEALTAETRASLNSYLLDALALVETAEAGRLFRKRVMRERREEQE
jgi:hypothetical protein